MFISELFQQKKVVSFEIFPPKLTSSIEVIYDTIDALAPLRPDFISVTYGAGGSTSKTTAEIASIVENKYNINSLAHLTCITSSKEQIEGTLTQLADSNVSNILALRGDIPKGSEETGRVRDFQYASDLVAYIQNKHSFCLGGACYPEGHPECPDKDQDIENLRRKVDAGVGFLVTQLFYDNDAFFRFQEKVAKLNINVPILAGIMPITNRVQIERILALSNARMPQKLIKILDKFEHNMEALKDAGIAYATKQIVELLANDIDGVHIYTMNKPQIAKDLVRNLDSLFYAVNSQETRKVGNLD
ncbi:MULTISPECIES: methylenetetrahydrofolate reductase [NAD(P)H] [Dehalobacter]|jgi:methylenetetrahydrofolate reductase (NADPH)|uniref:Methylenetetrahydrofolate reductase n=1 Tax=Dehalobacter restrictus (strain DSM 9455 / PER-K23) TaxID=871738 RepID=A0ABN4BV54_DEHRP|nr:MULTISPECIES: methylenetetrahydrofolate reductase [NAD(P)H] [Dehalobacter]AHF09528.1 5,10-methylenetetrahydrofolate reductase [Dehalobacter restrictus DSM 9455]MDJ0306302.1 methylenetetrahydrofolate reductase [NAD(P)H] [Dehalobacter sp.]